MIMTAQNQIYLIHTFCQLYIIWISHVC
jgi:hypothetical protein